MEHKAMVREMSDTSGWLVDCKKCGDPLGSLRTDGRYVPYKLSSRECKDRKTQS